MKKLIISLCFMLMALSANAEGVGYVNYEYIFKMLPLAQQYQTKLDSKLQEIKTYANSSVQIVNAQKTPEARAQAIANRKAGQQRLEEEYVKLRNERREAVVLKVKAAANVVMQQKQLDVIVDKENVVAGGVDCTIEILRAIR